MDILLFVLFILFLVIYVVFKLIKLMRAFTWLIVIQMVWFYLSIKYMGWAAVGGKSRTIDLYVSIGLLVLCVIYSIAAAVFCVVISVRIGREAKESRLPDETMQQAEERIYTKYRNNFCTKVDNLFTRKRQ